MQVLLWWWIRMGMFSFLPAADFISLRPQHTEKSLAQTNISQIESPRPTWPRHTSNYQLTTPRSSRRPQVHWWNHRILLPPHDLEAEIHTASSGSETHFLKPRFEERSVGSWDWIKRRMEACWRRWKGLKGSCYFWGWEERGGRLSGWLWWDSQFCEGGGVEISWSCW